MKKQIFTTQAANAISTKSTLTIGQVIDKIKSEARRGINKYLMIDTSRLSNEVIEDLKLGNFRVTAKRISWVNPKTVTDETI